MSKLHRILPLVLWGLLSLPTASDEIEHRLTIIPSVGFTPLTVFSGSPSLTHLLVGYRL